MEFFLLPLVGGIVLFVVMSAAVRAPGIALSKKFASLGQVPGKTLDEIVAVVGKPNAMSGLEEGKMLYQWQAPGYHVALRFAADGRCEGIAHQSQA